MTMSTAASSDLEIARALSRRLCGLETGPEPAGVSPYLRLAPSVRAAGPSDSSDDPATDEPLNDFSRWDELLAWSLYKVRSSASFAVDPQGFVIGSSGNVPADGFEGVGAELTYVMSQADVMKPEMGSLRSVTLEFANKRVAGFRADSGEAEGFVIAFIDAEILTEATRDQIARQLEHSFGVLL
jgi:hypothetical protein